MRENTMENIVYKRDHFICKRLRMLERLRDRGFYPKATLPDATNPRYSVWLFDSTPELEAVVQEYINECLEYKATH